MKAFKGKVAVITGAAGAYIARHYQLPAGMTAAIQP